MKYQARYLAYTGMKELWSPLLLITLMLLSSPAGSADDPGLMSLYRDALSEMREPLKRDDFRPAGLKTARDYDDLTQIYIEAGDYPKALEFAEKALELDGHDAIANLNAGIINYELEDYEKAVYYLTWALRIEEKLYLQSAVRIGEDLLSTAEPPSYIRITALLDKARVKAGTEAPHDEWEGAEYGETTETAGLLEGAKALVPGTGEEVETGAPEGRMKSQEERQAGDLFDTLRYVETRRSGAERHVGMRDFVSEIYVDEKNSNRAIAVVNEKWESLGNQRRLALTRELWEDWQGIKRKTGDKLGIYRIRLINPDKEVVGGSNWLNTNVWAKKPR